MDDGAIQHTTLAVSLALACPHVNLNIESSFSLNPGKDASTARGSTTAFIIVVTTTEYLTTIDLSRAETCLRLCYLDLISKAGRTARMVP